MALVAVGGYGRGELAPHSDLDVVLVHDEGVDPSPVAAEVWYPLWDSGARLDHSVRSLPEMTTAADADVRVASGLLDVRHVAGDPNLALRLRTTMLADWRRGARARLPELRRIVTSRHELIGELAHLSVPDLKEAEGGLRDATMLRALVATWLVDVPHTDLERSRQALLDVRDVVHDLAGRATDRVAPELWARPGHPARARRRPRGAAAGARDRAAAHPPLAAHLAPRRRRARSAGAVAAGAPAAAGAARPRRRASRAGRWCSTVEPGPPTTRPCCCGPPPQPPSATSCSSPATAARLVREGAPLPDPWPDEARQLLVRLLASGAGPAAGVGDAGGDRRAVRRAAGVGAGPAAAARLGDPPVHRRPARRRDLRGGVGADPVGGSARRLDGRRAAARHRQGRAHRAQRRGGADRPGGGDPDGIRRRGRRPRGAPGAPAPAARRDRHHPRPRRPRHRRAADEPGRHLRGDVAADRAHRGRREGHLAEGVDVVALRLGARPRSSRDGRARRRVRAPGDHQRPGDGARRAARRPRRAVGRRRAPGRRDAGHRGLRRSDRPARRRRRGVRAAAAAGAGGPGVGPGGPVGKLGGLGVGHRLRRRRPRPPPHPLRRRALRPGRPRHPVPVVGLRPGADGRRPGGRQRARDGPRGPRGRPARRHPAGVRRAGRGWVSTSAPPTSTPSARRRSTCSTCRRRAPARCRRRGRPRPPTPCGRRCLLPRRLGRP